MMCLPMHVSIHVAFLLYNETLHSRFEASSREGRVCHVPKEPNAWQYSMVLIFYHYLVYLSNGLIKGCHINFSNLWVPYNITMPLVS